MALIQTLQAALRMPKSFKNFEEFTTSGQFITPAEQITTLYIMAIGGGGGSASGANSSGQYARRGGETGTGGSVMTAVYVAAPSTPITIEIGAGGNGGVASGNDNVPGIVGGTTVVYAGNEPIIDAVRGGAGRNTSNTSIRAGVRGYSQSGFANQITAKGNGSNSSWNNSLDGPPFELFAGTGSASEFSGTIPNNGLGGAPAGSSTEGFPGHGGMASIFGRGGNGGDGTTSGGPGNHGEDAPATSYGAVGGGGGGAGDTSLAGNGGKGAGGYCIIYYN